MTHSSYFGTEAFRRYKRMNEDIFKVEAKARDLGMEEVRIALYRARIELGRDEDAYRREYTKKMDASEGEMRKEMEE